MKQHYDILGYLFLANGALVAFIGLLFVLMLGGSGAASGDAEAARILMAMGGTIGGALLVVSVPYFLTGYGLLKRLSWGRIAGIVVGALSLLSIPIGTAIGVYALWALTKPEARHDFA